MAENTPAPLPSPDPKNTSFSVDSPSTNGGAEKQTSMLKQLLGKPLDETGGVPDDENAFTKLFGRSGGGQATSGGATGASLKAPTLSTLLGPKPSFSPRAFEEKERERARTGSILFKLSLLGAVIVYVYFFMQLDPKGNFLADQLGPNVGQRFDSSAAEIERVQTDLNITKYRTAQIWLDEANTFIDPFFRQNAIIQSFETTPAQKQDAQAEFQVLGAQIRQALKHVQSIFQEPLGVDTFSRTPLTSAERESRYSQLLLERLDLEKNRLLGQDATKNQNEISQYDALARLIGNTSFRSSIASQDLDKISEEDFTKMLMSIREQGTDTISLIEKIRTKRPNWQDIISRIHAVTRQVDRYYGQGLFQTIGGFIFTSYRFDARTGRVSINGLTRTADSKTFSEIASLVDSIEKSPYFKDIDFRSFTKSRSEGGDYSSSVNLEFTLQRDDEKDYRDQVLEPIASSQ